MWDVDVFDSCVDVLGHGVKLALSELPKEALAKPEDWNI